MHMARRSAVNEETHLAPAARVPGTEVPADTEGVVDAALSQWREVFAALVPIIGQRGVAALFKRSLHLRQAEHPFLSLPAHPPDDFVALRAALLQQTAGVAKAANGALLRTFVDLLGRLIGTALTERLIGFAQIPASAIPTVAGPAP